MRFILFPMLILLAKASSILPRQEADNGSIDFAGTGGEEDVEVGMPLEFDSQDDQQ